MAQGTALSWQASLFDGDEPCVDRGFGGLLRHRLAADAWVDHVPGWLRGSDAVFAWLLREAPWEATEQVIHDRRVTTPRLVARFPHEMGVTALPPILEEIRACLASRYGREFDSVLVNLYRDGQDSVAWHGDRIARSVVDPLVATVSLGNPRRFLLRPRGGRTELTLLPGRGDLLVMGGTSQRTWQHSVPKTAGAGPRMSITLRHSR